MSHSFFAQDTAWAERVLAYEAGQALTAGELMAAAYELAQRLPKSAAVLNLCASRVAFLLGFVAAMWREQVTLMPSSHSAATLDALQTQYPELYVLSDDLVHHRAEIELPHVEVGMPSTTLAHTRDAKQITLPQIAPERIVARVFTSGSTGLPTGHDKRFGLLQFNSESQAIRLGFTGTERFCTVATVPVQHMYGFESSFLLPLMSGHAFAAERPFYPADIARVLAECPEPRVLVTTPVHLRVMLESQQNFPRLAALMSATAPLSPALARQAESFFNAPLFEIYGCTEAGQLSTRRSTHTTTWETYRGVVLKQQGDAVYASGGHVEGSVALGDYLQLHDETHFELLGRHEDMINIAGKRSSLPYLNHHLLAVEGVQDGAFYLPPHSERLCAFVVCTQRPHGADVQNKDKEQLLQALRSRLDAVFLPRPLYFVNDLPRNATGKLTQQALQALYAKCTNAS
ncbi:MAG: hypothetical protein RLZZ502_743 [Pseudomonadota bacterium]